MPDSDVAIGDLSNTRGGSRGSFSFMGDRGGESSAKGMRIGEAFAWVCGVPGRERGPMPAAMAALKALIVSARGDLGPSYEFRSGLRIVVNVGFALLPWLACLTMPY